jgi:V/A-type H+-transporting ATPase subunit A
MGLLQKEAELQDVVQLIGADALPDDERLVLETARLLRETFLQQNAYHAVDSYCPIRVQALMLRTILRFHEAASEALRAGAPLAQVLAAPSLAAIAGARFEKDGEAILNRLVEGIPAELGGLRPSEKEPAAGREGRAP